MKKINLRKFSARWCGPCQAMRPEWEKLKEAHKDWEFEEIGIGKNKELADKEGVRSVPTIIVSVDGEEKLRIVGYRTKEQVEKLIEEKRIGGQ